MFATGTDLTVAWHSMGIIGHVEREECPQQLTMCPWDHLLVAESGFLDLSRTTD